MLSIRLYYWNLLKSSLKIFEVFEKTWREKFYSQDWSYLLTREATELPIALNFVYLEAGTIFFFLAAAAAAFAAACFLWAKYIIQKKPTKLPTSTRNWKWKNISIIVRVQSLFLTKFPRFRNHHRMDIFQVDELYNSNYV